MDGFGQILMDTVEHFTGWAEDAGPKLVASVVILLIGWLAAKLGKTVANKALTLVKLDVLAEKAGVEAFLKRGNVQASTVEVISLLVYWLLLLLSMLVAVNALGISEAEVVFRKVFAIVPAVIVGVVILVLGLSFARFVSEVVHTAAANAGILHAQILGTLSRYTIVVFVVVLALKQLPINTELVSNIITMVFGAVALALALAFGLGSRDLAGRIAEDLWNRERAANTTTVPEIESVEDTDA
jgi:hypothetical protein